MILPLTIDELLSTTRAVRRRLDLERPVERDVLEECLLLAQQAPVASYQENWHFVVVTDPEKRAALGELWREFGSATSARARSPTRTCLPGRNGSSTPSGSSSTTSVTCRST